MNRLTRCPACTTIFRVTDEQLDSRQGFVRCGQCAKVFDARASLMEARDEPPTASAQGAYEDRPAASTPEGMPPSESGAVTPDAPRDRDITSSTAAAPPDEDGDPFEGMDVEEIVLSLDGTDPVDANASSAPDAAAPTDAAETASTPAPAADAATPAEPATAPVAAAPIVRPTSTDDDEPLPFGPKHRARSRAAAAAWGVGALLLLVVLAAQGAYWFRGELATALPEARPYLEIGCKQLNCTVPPPRQTALLSIESSELQVDKNVPGLLTLNATLRNRAAFAQQHPSIELTLTDADDRPMSRRVLAPADYLGDRLAKEPLFPAVSEHTVRLNIDATAFKPTGYRLFLFHP